VKLTQTKPALLFAVALALASCETPSVRNEATPVACSPQMTLPAIPEPVVPEEAWIVSPCDPDNPPERTTPQQCAEERAATAAFLGFENEALEWGREGWRRAAAGQAWCAAREAKG
jgi:hypothetical protein